MIEFRDRKPGHRIYGMLGDNARKFPKQKVIRNYYISDNFEVLKFVKMFGFSIDDWTIGRIDGNKVLTLFI